MRPWIIVNTAMSADGKLSTRERRQVRISGAEDFLRVDLLKASSDAVMVGIGTILADDPSLTVKSPELIEERRRQGKQDHPLRVVVDSAARISPDAALLTKGPGLRVIAVSRRAPTDRLRQLEGCATVIHAGELQVDLTTLLESLHGLGVRTLMVEGGGTLIWGLFREGLVDEMYTFIGNMVIGGKDAPTLADGDGFIREDSFARLELRDIQKTGDGVLLHWLVKK